jgi:dihydrofolate reductase
MRKVIVSNLVTLDGLFAGPNGEIDWHVVNDEFFEDANNLLDSVDTLLFGRVTYQGMESYWTSPAAAADDPIITGKMNNLSKVVFSKTLDKVEWKHSTLVKGDIGEQVSKLKQQPGKDMVIYGSGSIVSALTELGLIDEYRIFVVPVMLGSGKPLFQGVAKPAHLKLLRTKNYKTGVVLLDYQPDRG